MDENEQNTDNQTDKNAVLGGVLVGLFVVAWYLIGSYLLWRCCFKKLTAEERQFTVNEEQIYGTQGKPQEVAVGSVNDYPADLRFSPLT